MEPIAAETKAGAGVRCVARIIDGFVLVIPLLLISLVVSGRAYFSIGMNGGGSGWAASAIGVLVAYAYFVWCESARGATFGKSALHIVVVGPEGRPTLEQSARRNLWMLLTIIPVFGGFLSFVAQIVIIVSIARDPDGEGVHDRYAGVFLARD
jgi:uncharacterized RDD family membrane protein YckC